jgi:N-acetylglucosamine-6-phosphate deacetylase
MPPGEYRFGSNVDGPLFRSDGRVGRMPSGDLASSVMGLDHMVRVMARDTGAPLPDVVRMASLTPAERAGVARKVGSLERGKLADVLVLDKKLAVKRVFIGGTEFSGGEPSPGQNRETAGARAACPRESHLNHARAGCPRSICKVFNP